MTCRFLLQCLLSLALAFVVTACSHMPVTSLVKLARIDFETTDPAQLRAAVKLPRTVKPQPRRVVLRVAVRIDQSAEDVREFTLREIAEPPELAAEADADSRVFAYRLEDADIARLLAFRSELLAKKNSGQRGSISISIGARACTNNDLPEGPVYLTTYLRTAETAAYVALTRDVDLRSLASGRAVVDEIPRCTA